MLDKQEMRPILREFMETPRLSGFEGPMARRFCEEMKKYTDSVQIDRLGNAIATFPGTDPQAPSAMVLSHLDTIGFILTRIDEGGFLFFDRMGGVPEKVLPGIAVEVGDEDGGFHHGIIGCRAYHIQSPEQKSKVDPIGNLFIDIGAKSRQEVLAMGIQVGCPAIYAPRYIELVGDRIAGSYIDAAAGLTNLVQIASALAARPARATVHLVGTVWEEFSARGAMMAARTVKTDLAFSLLGPGAADTPDQRGAVSNVAMGGGPGVTLFNFHGKGTLNGNIAHRGLLKLLREAGEETGIPLQRHAARGALSDTAYLQLEGEGIPCIDLGAPDRYSHSPMETVDLGDLEQVGRLVSAALYRLDRDFDLGRYPA